MRKLFITCVSLLACLLAHGQNETEFTADRPGASTGPGVVGHHVVQLEQGLQYDGVTVDMEHSHSAIPCCVMDSFPIWNCALVVTDSCICTKGETAYGRLHFPV